MIAVEQAKELKSLGYTPYFPPSVATLSGSVAQTKALLSHYYRLQLLTAQTNRQWTAMQASLWRLADREDLKASDFPSCTNRSPSSK